MAPTSFIPISNTVCVMDASGYLGSSLVTQLLHRGYIVHASIQSHGEVEEIFKGINKEEKERLKVFETDVFDYQSIVEALKGCSALFYNFELPHDHPTYDEHTMEIEVRAAHNVLEACAQVDTIDKVVFTSSITAVIWKEDRKTISSNLDEKYWSDINFCRKFKLWHALSKTLAEKTAWALAMDRGINMVTVNGGLLVGPQLTVTHPYLKGAAEMYQDGVLVTVDLKTLVNAHICVFEDISSYGRYLCFNHVISHPDDALKLAKVLLPNASLQPQSVVKMHTKFTGFIKFYISGCGNFASAYYHGCSTDVFDVGSLPLLQQGQFPSKGGVCVGVQGKKKKKRRRRPKVCKNKEEAETQRRTHIAVERNRRKQMNEHLAVLRSLMPESYSLRGDQASVVGGAIDFVKELEHLVHSLEAQKLLVLQREEVMRVGIHDAHTTPLNPDVLLNPQHPVTEHCNKYTLKSRTEVAEVEVTLIETHANLRILSKKNPRQLSKLISGFQSLRLTILHLNVTSLDPFVLYSISIKVEEGCQLTSVDSISQAAHQMLRIIEEDVSSYFVNLLAT